MTAASTGSVLARADRPGVAPHLRRIDHDDGKPGAAQPGDDHRLEAARRLDRNERRRKLPQPRDQGFEPFAVARDGEGRPRRARMNIQTILRHVDADIKLFHHDPSLPKRARLAAPATVRVLQWINGRGAKLRPGLESPRMRRSPARRNAVANRNQQRFELTRMRLVLVETPYPNKANGTGFIFNPRRVFGA
jgi:hypothetical protein